MGSSVGGGSVDRALIKQQAGRRICVIDAISETMQHSERPVRPQAIDYSFGLLATEVGRTVQIASRVSHQPTVRASSSDPIEVVQDGFLLRRVDPKDDALTEAPPAIAVPYKLPAESRTRPAEGVHPSAPPGKL